jgi:hypothetical protein
MKRQEYVCDECELESHIFFQEREDVMSVIHKISDDHRKRSPKCLNPVCKMRVIKEEEVDENEIS